MAQQAKETIYIDAEDEITAIIDKVRAADGKIVALVLPKRSQALQSIVNLKLLKRTASEAKKNLVLITSDQNLMPIAGAVGMHVAKTPQSKPEIPAAPARAEESKAVETIDTAPGSNTESTPDLAAPIGVLAGDETIELDNDELPDPKTDTAKSKSKKAFNKRLKVPNFNKFRLLLVGGIALVILLIVGGVFAFVVLPKAEITIRTDTTNVSTDLRLVARTDVTELDRENNVIPAVKKELKKTENTKAPATGQKNVGDKAKGTVEIYNCNKEDKLSDTVRTVPAGAILSSNGVNFVLGEDVEVEPSSFAGNNCLRNKPSDDATVTAVNPGDQANLSARTYAVGGFPSMDAEGSAMSGGTSKIVQVVSQTDIDTAKQRLLEKLNAEAGDELKTLLQADGFLALEDSYGASEPAVATTPNLNDEAAEVTVSITITYTELGIKKDDLKTLVEESVKEQIDTSKQTIRDDGVDKATLRILEKTSADQVTVGVETISIAGPQLDAEGIRQEIAGKKKGATVTAIESRPGIQEVEVNYSPFWVHSTPKRIQRINISFDQGQ